MSDTLDGVILKGVGGLYTVLTNFGTPIECRARGKFRLDGVNPLPGDHVAVLPVPEDGTGYLQTVYPRRNLLLRPPMANLDLLVIVASAAPPVTDQLLIDKLTAFAEDMEIDALICVNKADMDRGEGLTAVYGKAGYRVIQISAETGHGVKALIEEMRGRICAFAGNSGVGKSSLINAIDFGISAETQAISKKIGRGRQTTRHVELFALPLGGYIADTPGFSMLDIRQTRLKDKTQLQYAFREFAPYLGSCRFQDCSHTAEPGCAVINAVGENIIPESRHISYMTLYDEVRGFKEWELK